LNHQSKGQSSSQDKDSDGNPALVAIALLGEFASALALLIFFTIIVGDAN
jgi:hypothetical protein